MNAFKGSLNTAEIQFKFVIFQFEADLIQIGLQTGLEQQALVDVFGEVFVSIVGDFNDIKHIFFAHVIKRAGILSRVGIEHGNAVAGGIDSCFGFVGKRNQSVLF